MNRRGLRATPEQLRAVQAVWGSYEGHLQHADAYRLRAQFHTRYPWLSTAMRRRRFPRRLDRQTLLIHLEEVR